MRPSGPFTAADVMLVGGFAAGAWWSTGGPNWAAIASIVAEQTALRMERDELRECAVQEAEQDSWNADEALTPLTLLRLGKAVGQPQLPFAAPLVLVLHDKMRAQGLVPDVGGARALVMLATMALEQYQKHRKSAPRANPRAARRDARKRML